MKPLYPWAMLATNYDDVHINWPMYVQPKLNGVRAKWDVERKCLVSRQGKVIPEKVLPALYFDFKNDYRGLYSIDGELWSPELSFQELCGAVNGKRKTPHEKQKTIQFYAFDIISECLAPRYTNWHNILPATRCLDIKEFESFKELFNHSRYDGLILRVPGVPYIVGRTEALIKWKPWKYMSVRVAGFIEGTGKFKGMLGAFNVMLDNDRIFKVGGGNITEEDRQEIWISRRYTDQLIQIRYRELSRDGIPLQPQIVKI